MDGYVTIGTELNTSRFDKQISLLEDKLEGLEQEYDALEKAKPFEGQNKELIKLGNEIDTTKRKIAKMRKEKEKIDNQGFTNLNTSISNIGNSMNNIVKKVAKWGLAIFGVRSAYLAIRQAMSTLSQYDNTMKANIDYIRFALATVLKPIIEWIINAVYKVLSYINYIANAWFGVNLFANASAKAFDKANKNAQKLQKTMLSFDEANVLSDNKDNRTATPSFDLSKMNEVQIPDWIKWIADNKDTIMTVATIAAGIFGAKVVAGWISNLTGFMGAKGLGGLSTALGNLVALAGGVVITVLVAQQVWKEAQQLKKEIQQIRESGAKAQEEWIKNENNINNLINTGNVNRTAGLELIEQSHDWLLKILGLDKENLKTAEQTAINIGKQIDKEIELYNQGKLNKEEQEKIKQNIKDQIAYNEKLIPLLEAQGIDTTNIKNENKRINTELYAISNNIKWNKDMTSQWVQENDKVRTGYDGVVEVLQDINGIKIKDKNAKVNVDDDQANRDLNALERRSLPSKTIDVNVNASGIAKQIETAFKGKKLIMTTYENGEVKIDYKANGGVVIPKLARGGIINQPGRGVPISAFGGESGAEGVIPLTNTQQMELLGSTIGKYININLTNITELDGRQIARKVEQINNNNNFVLNR